jgi:tetratricopeptide (TPR) repeat protein
MAKRKRRTQTPLQSEDELRAVKIVAYEITSEPIQDRRYKRLPHQVKDAIDRLHYEAEKRPHKAIPELLELIEKYPNIPMLYNYLSIAYSWAGQRQKSEEMIQENYRRNPDYLFARLNYAELYRARGEYDKIAEIFEHKFDLKLLYPKRKQFHISEVANFMGLIGLYFFETGERDAAEKYYDILNQIAPGYPMTKLLRRKLHPGLIRQVLHRLAGQTESDLP